MHWSADDRAKAMAYELEQSLRCQMCGTAPWEWDEAEGGSPHAYEAVLENCRGCYTREMASAEVDRKAMGVTVQLSPTRGPAAEARRRAYQDLMARSEDDD